jgi:hypothetical protein
MICPTLAGLDSYCLDLVPYLFPYEKPRQLVIRCSNDVECEKNSTGKESTGVYYDF